jgi:uncharacterized protein (TIGR03086 family)
MADAEVLTDLDRSLTATETVVAGIGADQWAAPTPCTELDVRGVLNHLVRGNVLFAAVIRDEPRPEQGTDHLGGDPLAAYQRAAGRLREAFCAPGVLDSLYAAPFGTGPGAVLAHVRVVEVLAHGWDLARATGQPYRPDPVLVRAALGFAERFADLDGGPFGPSVAMPADATPFDRLLGAAGRDPDWSPSAA